MAHIALVDDESNILTSVSLSLEPSFFKSSSVILGQGIDLSTPNNYSLTVSFTNPGDIDNSNAVFVLGGIKNFLLTQFFLRPLLNNGFLSLI